MEKKTSKANVYWHDSSLSDKLHEIWRRPNPPLSPQSHPRSGASTKIFQQSTLQLLKEIRMENKLDWGKKSFTSSADQLCLSFSFNWLTTPQNWRPLLHPEAELPAEKETTQSSGRRKRYKLLKSRVVKRLRGNVNDTQSFPVTPVGKFNLCY